MVQTSAQAGSASATVTAMRPVLAGVRVTGSMRWCTSAPSRGLPPADADGRGGDRADPQLDDGDRPRLFGADGNRILDPDVPGGFSHVTRGHDIPTRVQQQRGVGGQVRQRSPGGPAQGQALADPTRVERTFRGADRAGALESGVDPDPACGVRPGRRRGMSGPTDQARAALAKVLEHPEDRRIEAAGGHTSGPVHDRDGLSQPPGDVHHGSRACQPVERRQLAVVPEPRQRPIDRLELVADAVPCDLLGRPDTA